MPDCHERPNSVHTTTGQVTVALVGNPNVGKSTLFNVLTGGHQHTTNAPGTTVELQTGSWRDLPEVQIIDLPGTYSLLARSPDERVTAEALSGTNGLDRPDLAIVLVEAAALPRSLYLLSQVASQGLGTVVALTMTDVAATRGITVSAERCAEVLGVPVVEIDSRTGRGTADLAAAVRRSLDGPTPVIALGSEIPAITVDTVTNFTPALPGLNDLEAAEQLFAWVERTQAAIADPVDLSKSQPLPTPTGMDSGSTHSVLHRTTRSDRVDRVLLDAWFGVPVFLFVMWLLFELTTTVAAPIMNGVSNFINGVVADGIRSIMPGPAWLEGLVVDGFLAGVGTVLSFAPLMGIMFLAIAILEDSGYLARAAFVADKAMRTIGLDGRAMLPLIVGFGCNVPALAATRTLPNARQRLLTGLLIPYTSCSARLTVYILLASVFFPNYAGTAIFLMYVTSIVMVILGGLALRATAFRDLQREPLILALPAYQRPRIRTLLQSAWLRVRGFITRAGTIIVATLAIVWVLQAIPVTGAHSIADVPVQDSVFGWTAEAIAPVFAPAGFDDWHASAALVTGFVAKEVVVGSFAQSYAVDEPNDPAASGDLGSRLQATFDQTSGGHAGAAAAAFMIFVLAYTPCLATVAEQKRLFGARWTFGAVGVQLVIAWVAAVLVFQIGSRL